MQSFVGAFRPSTLALQWKGMKKDPRSNLNFRIRPSVHQKARTRQRLRVVDDNVEALRLSGVEIKQLQYAVAMPKEFEMRPKDKYWQYPGSRAMRWVYWGFRRPIQRAPNYPKTDFRVNPKGL